MFRFKVKLIFFLLVSGFGYGQDIVDFIPFDSSNYEEEIHNDKDTSVEIHVNPTNLLSRQTIDWANLQSPLNGNTNQCNEYLVFARIYIDGVTSNFGSDQNIEAWIGYSTTNSDPSTWSSSNWVPASFLGQFGNDDEYVGNLGPELNNPGTYYYASRFRYNGGPFVYGGYNSGFWDGTINVSGQVNISNEQPNFANVDFPAAATINTCQSQNIYAQVFEPGITDSPGQGSNITAWIGYNNISETYDVLNPSGWTWIEATYDADVGNNDQYIAAIGSNLPPGTYYYASRFQINCNEYSYGGIISDNIGNFWGLDSAGEIPYSGTLIVNDTSPANVVITEIMYNTDGTDDEWIEICNNSGTPQDLSLHLLTSSANAEFRFPCGSVIDAGECVTIALGSDGDSIFNNDLVTSNPGHCPFIPDFGIDPSVVDSNNLNNTSGTLRLLTPNETIIIDEVNYSSSDGANDNGKSLHVIDINVDNSSTTTNWQELDFGGSAGVNSLIPNCLPNTAEINVEGNIGFFPDIPDGDTTPSGLDNTLFASQFVGASQSKSYRISSLGAINISISDINLTGDTSDFTITQVPNSNIPYGAPGILEITFAPLSIGIKTATVTILNNAINTDNQSYTFTIEGEGLCFEAGNTISPTTGPSGTIVSVSGSNLNTATATLNGISMSVTHISDTEMEVRIPDNAETGIIEITDSFDCKSFVSFTVIDTVIGGCEENGTSLNEIFISEITDATFGTLSFIELYNPSNSSIDLSNYSLRVYFNGDMNDFTEQPLVGSISSKSTFVIASGTSGVLCNSLNNNDYDLIATILPFGINAGLGKDDYIGLFKNGALIDEWGEFGDDNWTGTTTITGDKGFNFRRKKTAINLPVLPFSISDWIVTDWVGSGINSCSTNNYSDIGFYDFSTGSSPVVSLQPNLPNTICQQSINISVLGQEGLEDEVDINYQWYYLAPGDSNWSVATNNSTYNNVSTSTLEILDSFNLDGYQYYCQIREEDETCYQATNAVRLILKRAVWEVGGWQNGLSPDLSTITIITNNFNTAVNNSFSSCQLFVESGVTLNIANNQFIEVENSIFSEGDITIETSGSLVQNSESAIVSGSGIMTVNKTTSTLETVHDYTYWSSPVNEPLIETALSNANPNRTFLFNAANFEDRFAESNNNNALNPGQDDVDDDGNAWQLAVGNETMTNGLGYAAMHKPSLYTGPSSYPYSFVGTFNTGPIDVDIFRSDNTIDDTNWNLIGNPYPSSITISEFLDANTYHENLNPNGTIDGSIYIWSQTTPPSSLNNGNEQINFSQNDYIIVNALGSVTPNANGDTNNGFIPSGQGFFVSMNQETEAVQDLGSNIKVSTVRFTNSMRNLENNNQFFRNKLDNPNNKIWLNLTSTNGVFSQILVGYAEGASSTFDGAFYDAKRSLSNNIPAEIYSIIPQQKDQFAIQGKAPSDLNENERIALGFKTDIELAEVYQIKIDRLEGAFLNTTPIFIVDHYKGVSHNLKETGYSFTSSIGKFEDRFEITFNSNTLSLNKNLEEKYRLKIMVLEDDNVQFSVGHTHNISEVSIYDISGKLVYNLKGNSFSETYYLPQLGIGPYMVQVKLLNNAIINSKLIKLK